MEKAEIVQELRKLHDAMVYGTSIIPGKRLIEAVFEAAAFLEDSDEIEIVVEV